MTQVNTLAGTSAKDVIDMLANGTCTQADALARANAFIAKALKVFVYVTGTPLFKHVEAHLHLHLYKRTTELLKRLRRHKLPSQMHLHTSSHERKQSLLRAKVSSHVRRKSP